MENKHIKLNDNIGMRDNINCSHSNPYFRTQVIAGYDHYIDNMGRNRFGEVLFEEENMTLIGGTIFTLEKLFNTRINSGTMQVSDLYSVFTDSGINIPTGMTPLNHSDNLNASNAVCLFGVGTGGAGDTVADIADVRFYQRNINNMVPLRQVRSDSELTRDDHRKYFCRSDNDNPNDRLISYYLKKFDSVSIKCKWRDSDNEAEGSDITSDYYSTSSQVTTPMETFVEIVFNISRDDVREYFENMNDIERARINTIGLYTGIERTLSEPIPVEYDPSTGDSTPYERTTEFDQITCYACLNFNNEMLDLPKDLTIVYRVFTK